MYSGCIAFIEIFFVSKVQSESAIILTRRLHQVNIGQKFIPYNYSTVGKIFRAEHYICIGSILQRFHKAHPVVWGTGLKNPVAFKKDRFAQICAVRGPLTRFMLSQSGIESPEIYGDPAILLPQIYNPEKQKKLYKAGIIPHLSDASYPLVDYYRKSPDIKIFDLKNYESIERFIDEMHQCEVILSSSLHGCIISDAYNIPNHWIRFEYDEKDIANKKNLTFDNAINAIKHNELSATTGIGCFKFLDYYLSCRQKTPMPLLLQDTRYSVSDFVQIVQQEWIKPDTNMWTLHKTIPFKHN